MLAGILAITNLNVVNAASLCSVEEQARLNKVAGSVKAVYEEAQEEVDPSTYITTPETGEGPFYRNYFNIIFTNITEDIYVKVINDYNDDVKFIRYQDTEDGTYTFTWNNIDNVVRFTYEVYTSNNTKCRDEKYFTNYLVTPKYNKFHDYLICEGIEDYLACQKYISVDMEYSEQQEKIEDYLEKNIVAVEKEKNKKWYEKIGEFVKEHKTAFIAGGSIIVIAGVATVVVKIKRKRENAI